MSAGGWLLGMSARRMVPLLMFAFAILSMGLRYQYQTGRIEQEVAADESASLRELLNIEQSRLDPWLGMQDALQVRRLVAALALHDGVERAYLVDGAGTLKASLSRLDLGRPLAEVLGELQGDPLQPPELRAWLNRGSPHAIEIEADLTRPALRAEVPLQEGHRLLVWQDLKRHVAEHRNGVQTELAREAVAVLLAVAALTLLLHLLWFRRAQQLSATLVSIGAGDLTVRTRLQGRDELAHIGEAADQMAEQLQRDRQDLLHLSELINRSPLVVIEWFNRAGWPVRYVSESVRQWGYTPDELLGGSLQYSEMIHPDDAPRVHAEVEHYLAHGPDHYRQEYRIRCADGRWAWVDDRTTLERDARGRVTGISGVLLDITTQKEAEQSQREQAEQLRMFFELPFLGMAVSSPTDKRWLRVNDRLCEILGYSREELLRLSWAEMTPPGDLERNIELFDELVAGKRSGYQMAKRFVRKDGRIVHAEIDVKALRDPEGRLRNLFATIQDVTERKAAREALQGSQKLLLRAQEIARMGSWSQDLGTGGFTWSPQTYAIHEIRPDGEPLSLDKVLGLLHPDDVARARQRYEDALNAGGQAYDIRYRLLMPDGRIKHLYVRVGFEFEADNPVRSVGMVMDETELQEAQQERDRLVSVMATTPDIVSIADPQGRVFYFNRAGYDVLGLPPDQPLDDVIRKVHPPWAAQRVLEEGIPTAIRDGRWLGETAVIDAKGQELPMSQLIVAHRGEDGEIEYFWTILRDISERKAVEAALELERTQLAQAQAMAHVGSWTLVAADQHLSWSDEHYRVLGYEPHSVEPSMEAFFAVVHPDDRAMVQAHLERDLQARASGGGRFEYRIVTAQGVRHVEQRANLELGEQGQLLRILGTTMDITERVQAEKALRGAMDLLEMAESEALLGSWAGDVQTQRVMVSDQLFRNLGLEPAARPPGEAVYLDRIHPDDRAVMAEEMRINQQGGPARLLVFRTNPAHGPVRWLRRTARRIERDELGLKPQYIGTLQDITEVVEAEEALRKANLELEKRVEERTAQLRQANQELEAFSYTVSHDLKAPLRGIDGYSQLLAEEYGPKLGEDGLVFVQRVRQGVQLMGDLINDLLEYSRMERRDMEQGPVELLPLVQRVFDGFEADIRRMNVDIQLNLPPWTLVLDSEGMAVVLRNLIGNAIKFSRNSQPPRVGIGGGARDGRYVLWVRDNGVGFDMKYHDKLFAIFQRLHRAEDFAGTGIGLAIVAKAVQRMGGRIWAESAPGAGATFYLEFPE